MHVSALRDVTSKADGKEEYLVFVSAYGKVANDVICVGFSHDEFDSYELTNELQTLAAKLNVPDKCYIFVQVRYIYK